MTYAAITEWMQPDERRAYDRELVARPGARPSAGVDELMRAMQLPVR